MKKIDLTEGAQKALTHYGVCALLTLQQPKLGDIFAVEACGAAMRVQVTAIQYGDHGDDWHKPLFILTAIHQRK